MKLTFILLTIAFLQVSATGTAQTVTYKAKNEKLEKVFSEIKRQTGFLFFYTTQDLESAKRVTVALLNVSIEEALDKVLADQPLEHVIKGNTIFIKARPSSTANLQSAASSPPVNQPPPIDIRGRIVNENGEPVIATVMVKGTKIGTTTNANGEFQLTGIDENAVLVISGVSIEIMEITVAKYAGLMNREGMAITAKTEIKTLNEIVINKGYYTEKQSLSTGNVSKVSAKEIEKQPVANPLLALQGRVPGMAIEQATGFSKSGITIRIRGDNSLANGNAPLYIIDGVPVANSNLPNLGDFLGLSFNGYNDLNYGNPLSYINPADIESIDVLKDADATAIYGSRGANGVILITTKKAASGKTRVDINMQTGWGKVTRKLDVLNRRQYLDMRYEAYKNDGASIGTPNILNYDLTLWDTTRSTDWQKELLAGTANFNDIQASVSGGNLLTQILLNAGYRRQTSVFPNDLSDQSGSFHLSLNNSSQNQKFKSQFTASYLGNQNQSIATDLTLMAITLVPVAPPLYKADGSLNWQTNASGNETWNNPLSYSMLRYKSVTDNLISNLQLSYKVLSALDIKSSMGYTYIQTDEIRKTPITYYPPSRQTSASNSLRQSKFAKNNIRSWVVEPQIVYSPKFGKAQLTAIVGVSIQQQKSNGLLLNASGFSSDALLDDLRSATTVEIASTTDNVYKYNALFARLNYNRGDKYLLNLTARRDGTSRFGPDKQFHNFAALGAGWIFSKENLIQKNLQFLSFGKLRGSYGVTGSDQVGDYSFMDLLTSMNVGVPYQNMAGLQINNLYTPDLGWEETKKLELGLELGFFKNRLVVSASHYLNRSSNQLTDYSLPSTAGFLTIKKNLNATVQNKGLELTFSSVNSRSKNFQWITSFNFSLNRNKLLSIDSNMVSFKELLGHPLTSRFVYHFIGVDPATGRYQFQDATGNATFNPNFSTDRTVLIDQTPTYFGGFSNSITYKSFQLDFLFQFVKQVSKEYLYTTQIIPGLAYNGQYNQPSTVLRRWQKPGDITEIQRFSANFNLYNSWDNASSRSDQGYSDGSFLRLKNISFSWQMHSAWLSKIKIEKARFYLHAQNVLTITKYKGLDPETKSSTSLPPLTMITTGIQFNF